MKNSEEPTKEKALLTNTANVSLPANAARCSSEQSTQDLRNLAVEIHTGKIPLSSEDLKAMSPEKSLQIFHELQVHQIELELQNEELRRAQVELADARTRYIDLYDLAPVGYLTISAQGKILEANRAATTLLGTARSTLAGQPISQYILNEYQDVYYFFQKQLFESGKPQVCELRMATNGIAFWAHLHASTATNVDGTTECRLVLIDITELKQAEKLIRQQVEQLHDSNEDLMIFNDAAVDRELRMIELKGEINELCKQTGQPPRYTLDFRMGGGESDGQ